MQMCIVTFYKILTLTYIYFAVLEIAVILGHPRMDNQLKHPSKTMLYQALVLHPVKPDL